MKRFSPLALLLIGVFLVGALTDALAQQKVQIQRVAMSGAALAALGKAPTGTFQVSTGYRIVPKGMKVYLRADTTGAIQPVTSYAWTIVSKPANSVAAIDTPSYRFVRFVPDLVGTYIVSVAVNGGASANDTITASTYVGLPATGLSCGTCHPQTKAAWQQTLHAQVFAQGISGQLEVADYQGQTMGTYGASCAKCHTTGWDQTADNGNYGKVAATTGFDTLWYKVANFVKVGTSFYIPKGDSTAVINMNTNYPTVAGLATIGCESCHGPGSAHVAAPSKTTIGISATGGMCMQCHDSPGHHMIGSYWAASSHGTMPKSGAEASRTACFPCHNGGALIAYAKNTTKPDYSTTEFIPSISCVACHDPHSTANPSQLRIMTLDKLANGYVPPAGVGGKGQLCMNCHHGREDTNARIAAQKRVFADRFSPHHSPQGDMFLGENAYEYGLNLGGMGTHQGLEDGCVTCHMQMRVNGSSTQVNHQMTMKDDKGVDFTGVCQNCHGKNVTSFDDIMAGSDYDGNGKIEGVTTEIDGMLAKLKAALPKGADGNPLMMKADFAKDSTNFKNHPEWYGAIWNYYFVVNDVSRGIHNTKYAVAILKASLGSLTGVELLDQNTPGTFDLQQNYPNPFNPSTTIKFGVSRQADVTLAVYNGAGELIATLASGSLVPGNYSAKWDASKVPSGMYFYRLTANVNGSQTFNYTKKMLLVK